ncbi:hypothetical protein D9M71_145180 [compost metagenome]
MERELRGLGEHTEQHQAQRNREQRTALQQIARGEHIGQLEAAHRLADQQDAGEQRQTAAPGHRQRHAGTLARIRAMVPEADQEERRQAGQLPEHQHQQQVLRQYHTEHGAHEQQQEGEEAPHRLLVGEVIAGVEDDQQADAEDQQGEEETEAIEAQVQVETEFRQPGMAGEQRFSGQHPTLAEEQHQADQGNQCRRDRTGSAPQALGQDWQEDPQKWQRNDQRQNHDLLLFHSSSGTCPCQAGPAPGKSGHRLSVSID